MQLLHFIKLYLSSLISRLFSSILKPSKHSSWRRLEEVFGLCLQKTSSRWQQSIRIYLTWSYVFKTSSRRFQDVFRTSWRRFQNFFKTFCKGAFKATSRRIQDVLRIFLRHTSKKIVARVLIFEDWTLWIYRNFYSSFLVKDILV